MTAPTADVQCHITLVHGTFATNAAWTKPGSAIRLALAQDLPNDTKIHTFNWSGLPSHIARVIAAEELRRFVKDRVPRGQNQAHYIVAHSHGANVALYAMRDAGFVQRVDGLISLSTPFIIARRRHLSLVGRICFGTFQFVSLGIITLAILAALFLLLAKTTSGMPIIKGLLDYAVWSWGPYVIVIPVAFLPALFSSASDRMLSSLQLPRVDRDKMLIIRGPGDEANALLKAVDLFQIIFTLFWGKEGRFDKALLGCYERFMEHANSFLDKYPRLVLSVKTILWISSGFYVWSLYLWPFLRDSIVLTIPLIAPSELPWIDKVDAFLATAIDFPIIVRQVIVFPFELAFILAALAFVSAAIVFATIGAAFVLLAFCLMIVTLPLVPEMGPLVGTIQLSTEVSPPGEFDHLQLRAETDESPPSLKHSITYADPEALAMIGRWIRQRIAKPLSIAGELPLQNRPAFDRFSALGC